MGFSIPVDNWFRTELRAFFEETVFRNDSKASSFLNTAGIRKLWQKHLCGTLNAGYQLWTILMFYLWADNYL
jgi:asparagine synthase (glutamine-hydrolysing)